MWRPRRTFRHDSNEISPWRGCEEIFRGFVGNAARAHAGAYTWRHGLAAQRLAAVARLSPCVSAGESYEGRSAHDAIAGHLRPCGEPRPGGRTDVGCQL